MKFRTGLIVGLAVGYYYGTRAGQERFDQIDQLLDRVRSSNAYQSLVDSLSAAVEDGTNRARELIDEAILAVTPDQGDTGRADGNVRSLFGDPTFN